MTVRLQYLPGDASVPTAGNLQVISRPATILPQQPTGGATIHRVNVGGDDSQQQQTVTGIPPSVTLTSQGLLTQVAGNNRPGILRRREGDRGDQAGKIGNASHR